MKVMKFGGASLADASRVNLVTEIIRDYAQQEKIIVVVSAVKGVTDSLIFAVSLYRKGRIEEALILVSDLYKKHLEILTDLKLPDKKYHDGVLQLNNLFGSLFSQLILQNQNNGWYDNILAFGERFSSRLVTFSLNKNMIISKFIDSSDLIVTDNSFGNASPLMDKTAAKAEKILYPMLIENIIPVVTGFYGKTVEGVTALLGRGGSDYSATILASVLDAQEVILWKEVNGIYDSDPKNFKNAKFYPELSYEKALTLVRNGAKILHPQALKPVADKEIIVWIKNTFNPGIKGSKIWKGKNGHI